MSSKTGRMVNNIAATTWNKRTHQPWIPKSAKHTSAASVENSHGSQNILLDNRDTHRQQQPTKRTKSRLTGKQQHIPSFHQFLHRQKVIHQYRDFMKALSKIDDPMSKEQLKRDIKEGYEMYKDNSDSIAIQIALKEVRVLAWLRNSVFCQEFFRLFGSFHWAYLQSFFAYISTIVPKTLREM